MILEAWGLAAAKDNDKKDIEESRDNQGFWSSRSLLSFRSFRQPPHFGLIRSPYLSGSPVSQGRYSLQKSMRSPSGGWLERQSL